MLINNVLEREDNEGYNVKGWTGIGDEMIMSLVLEAIMTMSAVHGIHFKRLIIYRPAFAVAVAAILSIQVILSLAI